MVQALGAARTRLVPVRAPLMAVVLALAVGWAQIPVIHDHATAGPGLYDGDCPSAKLAEGLSSAGPPCPTDETPLLPVSIAAPAVEPSSFVPALRSTFPARAPPRSTPPGLIL